MAWTLEWWRVWLDDPWRPLELAKYGGAVGIGDTGVDRSRADVLVPEMVLDELKAHAGVQEMGRNGVAQAVASQVLWELSPIAIPHEARLDLPLAQWT